ncbi:Cullin repeat-containing protein [Macrolepiota fuliginosa MF-IS2]|uniref:Cullin repeat-containing protein n=1 Tax=Macrolepiota fuliginosa MF-IS2 TaxID=1400762 RepID=A0A9P5X0J5_9AGAR|nr:Cullin repeat-containing protein [Macrolepiota fuliginosa MF-IS2]
MAHNATNVESRLSNMPGKRADLNQVWAYLTAGADHIMTGVDISLTDHANLYTTIYNYCGPKKVGPFIAAGNSRAPNLVGPDLYNKIHDYFPQHIQPIIERSQTLQDVDLLRYYAGEWDRYVVGASRLDRVFTYLNRYWVKRERDEGKKGVYPVYTLALAQWKAHCYLHIQKDNDRLTNAIVGLINQERNGELIDQDLIKKVVNSFVALGVDKLNLNKECLDVYSDEFEAPFLQATENYYTAESEAFLAKNSVLAYLKKVEERLREEEARAEHCLHAKTHENLVKKCEDILIQARSELIWEEFQTLLDFGKDEDLQRMCTLLSRVPHGLEPLHEKFEAHVKQVGLTSISKLVEGGFANVESIDPKAYVDALFEVHRKNSEIVQGCFGGEVGFAAGLDRACRGFVNRNAATGSSLARSSEVIAKHVDMLLREGQAAEEDNSEGALDHIIVLYNYLEDRDALKRIPGVDRILSRPT